MSCRRKRENEYWNDCADYSLRPNGCWLGCPGYDPHEEDS